ncbi:MAG: MFS transporter [Verrucomicrobiota bacterium]
MTTPTSSFWEEIRGLERPIWIISGGVFLDRFGLFVVPFLVLFLTSHDVSKTLAGVAVGFVGLGSLIGSGLGGYLSDRLGRRKTMGLALFGAGAFSLSITATAHWVIHGGPFALLLIAITAYGTCRGSYHAASSSLVADLVPPTSRVAAFAVLRFAINLGFALGMASAGFLAEFGFILLFVIDAVTSWFYAAISVTLLPPGRVSKKEECGWGIALRHIRTDHRFLRCSAALFIMALIFVQWHSSFAVWLESSGYSTRVFGWVMALNGMLIILFEMPLSALTRRFAPPLVIGVGALLAGIGFALIAWIPGIVGLVIAMTIFTLGEMIALPVQAAYSITLAPQDMRGRYNGVTGATWSLAGITGPSAGLLLLGQGILVLCLGLAALGVIGFLICLAGRAKDFPENEDPDAQSCPTAAHKKTTVSS